MADDAGKPVPNYFGHNPETERLIAAVIAQLPADVGRFASAKCAFVSNGTGLVMTLRPLGRKHPIVLAQEFTRDDRRGSGVVAHGIAHAWLQHNGDDADEMAVVRQCQAWQFDTTDGWKDSAPGDGLRVAHAVAAKYGVVPEEEFDLEELARPWPAPHVVFCDRAVAARRPALQRQVEEAAPTMRARAERFELVGRFIKKSTPAPEVERIADQLCQYSERLGQVRAQDRPAYRRRFMQSRTRAWESRAIYLNKRYCTYGQPAAKLFLPALDLWLFEDVVGLVKGKRRSRASAASSAAAPPGALSQPRALSPAGTAAPCDRDTLGS
jgi:hypothetical protein